MDMTNSAIPTTKFTTPSRPLTFLITGCSSGLGLCLARAVQAAGHTLIATSRDPSRTPNLVSEIEARGGRWLALTVDAPDCASVINKLEAEEGTAVDVLVNNAGWSIHHAVEHFTDDEARAQMEVVYFGPYRLIRAVLPHMRRRRFGVVVNISSVAGLEGRESMGVYSGAKAALDALSKVLYKEVAEFNVRVLTVCLGSFRTNMGNVSRRGKAPMADDYRDKAVDKFTAFISSGAFVGDGDPDKAARAILEVVLGEGVGAGREGEMLLPLGRDVVPRVALVRDRLQHALDVFEGVANGVAADGTVPLDERSTRGIQKG